MLFFSKPIRKFDYLTGRFAGSMVVSFALIVIATLGIVAGEHVPWQDAERLGPFTLVPYLYGLLVLVLPNLVVMGAIFFAVAPVEPQPARDLHLCRRLRDPPGRGRNPGDELRPGLAGQPHRTAGHRCHAEHREVLDDRPSTTPRCRSWPGACWQTDWPGSAWVLSYCSPQLCPIQLLALHRPGAGGAEVEPRRHRPASGAATGAAFEGLVDVSELRRRNDLAPAVMRQTKLETATVLRSSSLHHPAHSRRGVRPVLRLQSPGEFRGTDVHPVTYLMLQSIQNTMGLFLLIVVIVYSGELAWRERSLKLVEVYGALPVPNGVFLAAKLLTLVLVVAIFLLSGILSTIAYQISQGFFDLRLGLYLRGLLVLAWPFVLLAILAFFLQVLVNNKFLGYLLMIIFIVSRADLPLIGVEHNLLRFPGPMGMPYSDMNGYGHFVARYILVQAVLELRRRVAGDTIRAIPRAWNRVLHRISSRRRPQTLARRGPDPGEPSRSSGFWPVRDLHFLQHQRPQSIPTQGSPGHSESRVREAVPALQRHSSAANYGRLRRRRHFPRRAARRDSRVLPAGEQDGCNSIEELHVSLDPEVRRNRVDLRRESRLVEDTDVGYHIYRTGRSDRSGRDDRPRFRSHGAQSRLRQPRLQQVRGPQRHVLQQRPLLSDHRV